jgi:FkbM family methyltransferase
MNKERRRLYESYELLKKNGFHPATVIDVGVANGTPELYKVFPEAYFLLIEPLVEFENKMKSILETVQGSYELVAAGSKNMTITLNVHNEHLDGSSILKEEMGSIADGTQRTVPMLKVEDIVKKKNVHAPILLKVDVQGAELEVLKGCVNLLSDIEVIVLEVSLFNFMKESPDFYDVVEHMKNIGYVAYDILFGWNRPLDNALGQVDIVFVKENGFLRENHAFSTVEQLDEMYAQK